MAIRNVTQADLAVNVIQCGDECNAIRLGEVSTWAGLLNGDTGEAVRVPQTGVSLIANLPSGTLGAGGKVCWEGYTEGMATFLPLHHADGDTPAFAEQTMLGHPISLLGRLEYVRPRVTAGDEATDLVATLLIASGRVDQPESVAALVGVAFAESEKKGSTQ